MFTYIRLSSLCTRRLSFAFLVKRVMGNESFMTYQQKRCEISCFSVLLEQGVSRVLYVKIVRETSAMDLLDT